MSNALATDFYQLTMMQAFWESGYNPDATFDYFVRKIPLGSYLVVAGLENVVEYIKNLRFDKKDIRFLSKHGFYPDFIDYLREFKFTGDVFAMPEGSIAFQNEPIITVTAPIMEAQLIETYLLNKMNFSTLVATKAARVVQAANGKDIIEFGMRRAHGEGYLEATRAAYVGGCSSSSNVMAGVRYGIPVAGTMAHSFVMSFESEIAAFRAYASVYPDKSIFLVDTYDTIEGTNNAIAVAKELESLGKKLIGVRIDSGDLLSLSKKVRRMLDRANLGYVKIMASGDLNEWRIKDLLDKGAPIDMFGVGTELVTAQPKSALGGIYKLSEIYAGTKNVPKMKITDDAAKMTMPGRKAVWRIVRNGKFDRDIISLANEKIDGVRMLHKVIENGEIIMHKESLDEIRSRLRMDLEALPSRYKELDNAVAYPVELSKKLAKLGEKIKKNMKNALGTRS